MNVSVMAVPTAKEWAAPRFIIYIYVYNGADLSRFASGAQNRSLAGPIDKTIRGKSEKSLGGRIVRVYYTAGAKRYALIDALLCRSFIQRTSRFRSGKKKKRTITRPSSVCNMDYEHGNRYTVFVTVRGSRDRSQGRTFCT